MSIRKSLKKRAQKIHSLIGAALSLEERTGSEKEKEALRLRYEEEMQMFTAMGGEVTHQWQVLSDYKEQAGTASGHYFHQDLLVASMIHEKKPRRHIDVGSRIDGFVAHVAAYRKIEVLDVRDLVDAGHANISFIKSDLMETSSQYVAASDSVSSLHALEHFGLGRYGDPLDPNGHLKGFQNIARMVEPGGFLYISIPIGESNEVHFNAHRVFDPLDILKWPQPENGKLTLTRFDYVDDSGILHKNVDLQRNRPSVAYGCGIYTFRRSQE